jgi:hypothetical protein
MTRNEIAHQVKRVEVWICEVQRSIEMRKHMPSVVVDRYRTEVAKLLEERKRYLEMVPDPDPVVVRFAREVKRN